MYRHIFLIFLLSGSLFADVEPYDYVFPIVVEYRTGQTQMYWTTQTNSESISAILHRNSRDTGTGMNVLYPGNIDFGDSLKVSLQYHYAPDSARFLIEHYVPMGKIRKIYNAASDSIPVRGIWVNPWFNKTTGNLLQKMKPVYSKLIVLEEEAAYNAIHLYVYDKTINTEKVEKILIELAYQYHNNPYIQNALKEHKIALIDDITP